MINASTTELIEVEEIQDKRKISKKCILFTSLIMLLVGFVLGYLVSLVIHKKSVGIKRDTNVVVNYHAMVTDEISNTRIENIFRTLTKNSHTAGGPNSYTDALRIKELWEGYGLQNIEIKQYNVMLSTPKSPGSIIVKDGNVVIFESHPNETVLIEDENVDHIVSPYNAYSASGSVKGGLVYVNYGTMNDFFYLRKHNISLSGKIAFMRYGKSFRANKVQLAEQAGAIGVILFSDPADYSLGSVKYPKSWWLPPDGLQRGTVNHLDADPQTLGYPAIDGIYRVNENKTDTPKIPVQPISYSDAFELMRNIDGKRAPSDWQGKMNITYRLTSTPNNTKEFILTVNVTKTTNTPIYNVIGKIVGQTEPDRIILLGNHHDAWVIGGLDPISGTATLTEIVQSVTMTMKKGWRPHRTIMFCSWDAEEFGLVGSTEWIEDHSTLVSNQVVAYLNVDSAVTGNFTLSVKASSQIASVVFEAAKKIADPDKPSKSLFDTWKEKTPERNSTQYPRIRIPGSGSDFQPFFVRYGIPVTDIRYTYDWDVVGHISSAPTYHSLHDSFYNAKHFVDPDFIYSATIAKVWVLTAAILADSVVIPYNFTDYARRLDVCQRAFVKKYSQYMDSQHLSEYDFIVNALNNFSVAAQLFDQNVLRIDKNNFIQSRMMNDKIMAVERAFISPHGLPDRPFIKHVLYGPSKYNIYLGHCFPALVDDIMEIKYYNRTNNDRISRDISHIYYHILQATQVLTL